MEVETKLDKIIELLIKQNKSLDLLVRAQTTNNHSINQVPWNHGTEKGNIGASGFTVDTKSMIEDARAKALQRIKEVTAKER